MVLLPDCRVWFDCWTEGLDCMVLLPDCRVALLDCTVSRPGITVMVNWA